MNTFLITLGVLLGASFANAGQDGGGGDAIRCNDGKLYFLDFIQSKDNSPQFDSELLAAKSGKQVVDIIARRMANKLPLIAYHLKRFMISVETSRPVDNEISYIWKKDLLTDIPEQILYIPKECIAVDGQIKLYQAVVLGPTKGEEISEYRYDEKILKELEQNSPFQTSFLYVHEFLRQATNSDGAILKLNRLLHSRDLIDFSAEELADILGKANPELKGRVLASHETVMSGLVFQLEQFENLKKELQQIFETAFNRQSLDKMMTLNLIRRRTDWTDKGVLYVTNIEIFDNIRTYNGTLYTLRTEKFWRDSGSGTIKQKTDRLIADIERLLESVGKFQTQLVENARYDATRASR